MNAFFKKSWVTMLVNGIIAAIIGILLLFVKGDAINVLIKWLGIVFIIVAATLIGVDIYSAVKKRYWGSLTFVSVFLLVAGIIFAIMPGQVWKFIAVVIGIWAILTGVFQIITTIKYKSYVPHNTITIVNGILLVALGILFVFYMDNVKNAITYIAGAFLIISGIWEIFNAFRFKKISNIIENDDIEYKG
ncbi:MAG: DUF308 domain-containing protein [Bacteroidales bacterium]|jgi:uncharacterized membrane protein HdeD (DUF308 family)|nr:DUF308 domain-containing protein [Bacteroidales bacterium]